MPDSVRDRVRPPIARLIDAAGRDGPATPADVAGHLRSGEFFWLDLEQPGDDDLAEFRRGLQLPAGVLDSVPHARQRSSLGWSGGSVRAVLPAAVGTRPAAWIAAEFVSLLLTEQFLVTVHPAPCAALRHARDQYGALDEGARKDALDHHAGLVAGRQAQVISGLTIVATVFLPLSFLTGYFGMNFRILTNDLQTSFWQFVLLALVLPATSVALSLLLIRRLERRLGIRRLRKPPS
ncbi:hypothetical protein GCM10010168_19650 [Actinoplanes ianthinogenes]|uniref:Uncharacterized protein n=1 Tax=Actinoplanes ianthinogenes TaxID=122358 RepID=A0ABM7M7K0_9ACTN|nr:CorA family divalent cation transporter [Actinoplanes ianthinogenes]BCJ47607.1 hypothetical protein Aiant_82640 [Actinoplanes ianthinogenes]GGR02898.1 hypothetical protein GCM10010168_19650 [Actinoplanes ianthinogenes]